MKSCETMDIMDSKKLYLRVSAPEAAAYAWVRSFPAAAVPVRGAGLQARTDLPSDGLQPELFEMRDQKLAERSALRLSALVHDYSDAIIIRDFKDRIIAWNRGAQRMYGYTEEEALGMDAGQLIPKKMPPQARETSRRPVHGHKQTAIVTRRRTKDGRILDVELTFKVLCDEKGVPVELATTERDITQQLKADRELRRLHARVISVQETERKRLARELHDGVGQILSGVKFRLESLPGKIALSGKSKAKVLELGGILDHAISEVRRVSKNLMPPELEDLGLEPALRTLCREFNGRGGAQVTLNTAHIPETVAPELALALFRITQEALNNTGKHARATEIEVNLSVRGMELLLNVSDNGIGFVPGGAKPPSERGIGLGSMRERAEAVGGSVDLRSSPGAGTKLAVRAPLLTPGGSAR
jgi:two-component system sensor histidine kinase NreB